MDRDKPKRHKKHDLSADIESLPATNAPTDTIGQDTADSELKTSAELFQEYKKQMTKQNEEAFKLLAQFKLQAQYEQRDIDKFQAEIQNGKQRIEELEKELESRANMIKLLEDECEKQTKSLERKVRLYSDMFGLQIKKVDERPRSSSSSSTSKSQNESKKLLQFQCVQYGRNCIVPFELRMPLESEQELVSSEDKIQLTYRPRIDVLDSKQQSHVMKHLPDYLTEEISFPKSQTSMFAWRILNSCSHSSVGSGEDSNKT